ncbi:MAG TPA: helix-turn-helix domain-containing protein, partial [Acidimicrobiales bacterium]|nr:helix-turn-helix domain-containing protein [Acidimicrobiales bacterium]
LENGDLARLPDQALAISTLRRYATFLGLDGDALALQMIDAWSTLPKASGGLPDHGAVPVTSVVAAVTAGPDHLRAFTQTGRSPRSVGGRTPPPAGWRPTSTGRPPGLPRARFPSSRGTKSARASGRWPRPGGACGRRPP